MDILYLIDELESRLTAGRRLPLTSNIVVDEEEFFDIINEMRSRIPEEVKQAQKIVRERDRIIAQAHEEAERLVALAEEKAKEVLGQQEIVKGAQARADTIIERAQLEADKLKTDADDYVIAVLSQLGSQLEGLMTTVQNGIQVVHERGMGPEGMGAEEKGRATS
jgi:cell division septum initiation protein DivIVA